MINNFIIRNSSFEIRY